MVRMVDCFPNLSWKYFTQQYFQSQEVEETLKRIQSHKGVVGTIVVNNEGKLTIN